jgi:hypothetical protein
MTTPKHEDCPKCGFPMIEQQWPRQEVCRGHEEPKESEEEDAGEPCVED